MHLVEQRTEETNEGGLGELSGVPLSIVFADGPEIEALRARGEGTIPLEPPFHVSDEDAYLLLPADIGLEIIDILADADTELLHEAMRDGLVVLGSVVRNEKGDLVLAAEEAHPAAEALAKMPFAAEVSVSEVGDLVDEVNALPHVECTMASLLLDEDGLERILREPEHVGVSWRVPENRRDLVGVDPTYTWSRRFQDRVGIELALFLEYEELVVLLRPVAFVA
jgi:hypothetical protein